MLTVRYVIEKELSILNYKHSNIDTRNKVPVDKIFQNKQISYSSRHLDIGVCVDCKTINH